MNGAQSRSARRVRYTAANGAPPGPWFEIVGDGSRLRNDTNGFRGGAVHLSPGLGRNRRPSCHGRAAPGAIGATVAQRGAGVLPSRVDPGLRIARPAGARRAGVERRHATVMAAGGSVAAIVSARAVSVGVGYLLVDVGDRRAGARERSVCARRSAQARAGCWPASSPKLS